MVNSKRKTKSQVPLDALGIEPRTFRKPLMRSERYTPKPSARRGAGSKIRTPIMITQHSISTHVEGIQEPNDSRNSTYILTVKGFELYHLFLGVEHAGIRMQDSSKYLVFPASSTGME